MDSLGMLEPSRACVKQLISWGFTTEAHWRRILPLHGDVSKSLLLKQESKPCVIVGVFNWKPPTSVCLSSGYIQWHIKVHFTCRSLNLIIYIYMLVWSNSCQLIVVNYWEWFWNDNIFLWNNKWKSKSATSLNGVSTDRPLFLVRFSHPI